MDRPYPHGYPPPDWAYQHPPNSYSSFSGDQHSGSFHYPPPYAAAPPPYPHPYGYPPAQPYGYPPVPSAPPPEPSAPPPPNHYQSFRYDAPPAYQAPTYPPLDNRLENLRISEQTSSPSVMSPSHSFRYDAPPAHQAPIYHPPSVLSPSNSFHQRPPGSFMSPSHSFSSQQGNAAQIVPFHSGKISAKVLLLHGSLDVWIFEAKNLPNMDTFSKTIVDIVNPKLLNSLSGKLEEHRIPSITSDPYVTFGVSTAVLGRTFVISNSENPNWNQHFLVPVAHYGTEVLFVVKDSDVVGSQLIGTVAIQADKLYEGVKIEGVFPVLDANGKPYKRNSTLRLSIQYIPADRLTMYHHGVGPGYIGVPGTYFPLRKGGKVRLYQDAHVPDGCLPPIVLERGMMYEHGRCWEDISRAINEARRLIYITGWSVYHEVRLVREGLKDSAMTLGELLKRKSQEGVRVLLLVWNDPTSRSILGYTTEGLMATHDEETLRFFKHSSVKVVLCPRSAGKRHSLVKQTEVGAIYTHHQKTVIVDADAGNNWRKIIAFVGGLDLCDGRYDTPKHDLFRTLDTVHKDDYHNPTFTGTNTDGPREPWHDLHSRIDGSAAYDVLKNFEQRWMKATKKHGIKKLRRSDDSLLIVDRIPDIISLEDSVCHRDTDPETWHTQIFRSIDSNSVKGFPKDPREASMKNLISGKNVLIDMSIHTAYVTAIRAAQHFIYIENQYFLGSSYNWSTHKSLGADNLIPMEIALKIADKIKANERFSAYIVIPMWPEGDPKSVPMQRILCWQKLTMQMMYETIYKALAEVGLENTYSPQDYLNFFCLGNRETPDPNIVEKTPTSNAPNANSRKSRRFMIYVHSKGMIVDDEYVIIGSANINQRSLEGTRDTEIAMGAFQPHHSWSQKPSGPRGQIFGYRMSLWAEHLGFLEDTFTHPESLECMRRVRSLGEMHWTQFASDQITEMRGHLLKYPVSVDNTGKVSALPGCKEFPDVGGTICPSVANIVPENLTI